MLVTVNLPKSVNPWVDIKVRPRVTVRTKTVGTSVHFRVGREVNLGVVRLRVAHRVTDRVTVRVRDADIAVQLSVNPKVGLTTKFTQVRSVGPHGRVNTGARSYA